MGAEVPHKRIALIVTFVCSCLVFGCCNVALVWSSLKYGAPRRDKDGHEYCFGHFLRDGYEPTTREEWLRVYRHDGRVWKVMAASVLVWVVTGYALLPKRRSVAGSAERAEGTSSGSDKSDG